MGRVIGLVVLAAGLWSCGGSSHGPITGGLDEGLTNTVPVIADGPYASVLKDCALARNRWQACDLAELPPLRLDHPNPTTDDIMSRALVSHPWMGERLREVLDAVPEDLRYLFGAISAVVIDDDIRPSYYSSLTGAIYLDPGRFWLTDAENSIINIKPDYRDSFDDPMSFRSFWRYVPPTEPRQPESGRTLEQILPELAALLFHELAHANDFIPPDADLDLDKTFGSVADALQLSSPSSRLKAENGLESELWQRLAGIIYRGVPPSADDTLLTPAAVGAEFDLDVASDDYGYTTQYEDLAMVFEEAMMRLHFGIVRDIAFVRPAPPNTDCDANIIGWGMRGRVGDPAVKIRAQKVISALLPDRDYSEFFENLPAPTYLPVGTGWCASRRTSLPSLEKAAAITAPRFLPVENTRRRGEVVR